MQVRDVDSRLLYSSSYIPPAQLQSSPLGQFDSRHPSYNLASLLGHDRYLNLELPPAYPHDDEADVYVSTKTVYQPHRQVSTTDDALMFPDPYLQQPRTRFVFKLSSLSFDATYQ